ncbi:MAG: hypothetical protein OEL83_08080 [Desulforhopalus sp.]|nr:hypothetical protein [Desulforhopalus sp.]
MAYAAILTVVASGSILYVERSESSRDEALRELAEVRALETGTKALADTTVGYGDDGGNRGFILAGMAFLEKYKERIPDTYAMARRFAEDGAGVTKTPEPGQLQQEFSQRRNLDDGAKAMSALLRGLAKGK